MAKYLTFGFDDCEIHDRRLAELFRRYGMEATFFLISGQLGMKCPFHRYGEDTTVERVSAGELRTTYRGLEVASHTAAHTCPIDDLPGSVGASCRVLSDLCGYPVDGLAYPGGSYTPAHIPALRAMGIRYARTTACTYDFDVPQEFLAWNPTCRYDDARVPELVERFLNLPAEETCVFYLYGHSYEMTRKGAPYDFASFERLLQHLAGHGDVTYATNRQVWAALQE